MARPEAAVLLLRAAATRCCCLPLCSGAPAEPRADHSTRKGKRGERVSRAASDARRAPAERRRAPHAAASKGPLRVRTSWCSAWLAQRGWSPKSSTVVGLNGPRLMKSAAAVVSPKNNRVLGPARRRQPVVQKRVLRRDYPVIRSRLLVGAAINYRALNQLLEIRTCFYARRRSRRGRQSPERRSPEQCNSQTSFPPADAPAPSWSGLGRRAADHPRLLALARPPWFAVSIEPERHKPGFTTP